MKQEHGVWIGLYEAGCGGPAATIGRCKEAVEAMVEVFPELRVVKGHAICPEPWGKRGHWWCVDVEDNIVDPTCGQFTCGVLAYEEFKEGDEVRVGVCMECGDGLWTSNPDNLHEKYPHMPFCSSRCQQLYAEYAERWDTDEHYLFQKNGNTATVYVVRDGEPVANKQTFTVWGESMPHYHAKAVE